MVHTDGRGRGRRGDGRRCPSLVELIHNSEECALERGFTVRRALNGLYYLLNDGIPSWFWDQS